MKKLFCLLLALSMTAAVLTGCGAQNSGSEKDENESQKKK